MSKGPVALTQSVSYLLLIMLCFMFIGGSFLLKMNYGKKVTDADLTINYAYQNEGKESELRNHYRKIKVVLTSITSLSSLKTKSIRVSVFREGEYGDTGILNGKVFSVILEDMAKFKSAIFDYNKCVKVGLTSTDITILLFKQYDNRLVLKTLTININRQTDKLTLLGKEITASDIWSNNVDNSKLADHKLTLDKGYLQILLGGELDQDSK